MILRSEYVLMRLLPVGRFIIVIVKGKLTSEH